MPSDLAAAHAMILAERAAWLEAEATIARERAASSCTDALIARLKLEIEKLRREFYGTGSERKARLLDQLEMQEELEADATEDELAAEAATQKATVGSFERKRPARKPFPDHLPRERVIVAAPESCPCCGSPRLVKLGEDISETLEVKMIQTVRERFSCRACEAGSPPPAPFHVIPRGHAGPNLLAMVLFEKLGQHQPLNRQSECYVREGIDLPLSTLADHVGAYAAALRPLHVLLERHVMAVDHLHGDDTPVPIPAKGKTDTGRTWVYVRDDRPFGGAYPPAVLLQTSRDRSGDHPQRHLTHFAGIPQADAFAGYNRLLAPGRQPGPIVEALCWAHARRKFFELADIAANRRRERDAAPISPIAFEAVTRIDALFDIEREINGVGADQRRAVRQERSAPLIAELEAWMREHRARLFRHAPVAQAMDYMLRRGDSFTRFLDDGRVCLTNNAAERTLRGIALGRKAWLFAGSDRGAERAAVIYRLIGTARLNDIDLQAWLADVLARIADTPQNRLYDLLPWNWHAARKSGSLAA